MKRYKFITIEQPMYMRGDISRGEEFDGKPAYRIANNKDGGDLGALYWWKPWKQYILAPQSGCVFNNSCLRDIIDFIENEISL